MPKIAPPSPTFIGARHHGGSQTPRAVVMHATVSPDDPGTARDIAEWWHGASSPVTSAHYVVDPRETIQCVGDHTIAYHCGYNTGSIAVEMCDEQTGPANRWADADSRAIIDRSALLVARLCLAYGIEIRRPSVAELKAKGPHGIYGHDDSRLAFGHTSHTDPRDFDWPGFIARVHAAADQITGGKTADSPEEDDMPEPKDLWNADVIPVPKSDPRRERNATFQADNALGEAWSYARRAALAAEASQKAVEAMAAAIDQLAPGVKAAVRKAVEDSINANLRIEISDSE